MGQDFDRIGASSNGRRVALLVAVAVVLVVAALGSTAIGDRDAVPGASASRTSEAATVRSPSPSAAASIPTEPRPSGPAADSPAPSGSAERAFADAYLALADAHDGDIVDLLIANPLSEYDLVGERLIDRLEGTRRDIDELPPLATTAAQVHELGRQMASTVALLRAIEPHGPRADQQTAFVAALDYWTEHVRPIAEAIRAAVTLPPVAPGDLRL